jgi:hypothetical protein
MRFVRGGARRSVAALLALIVVGMGSASLASEDARVGRRPAPVLERRNDRAAVLVVLSPGTPVQVLDREDGWCWVIVQTDTSDGRGRPGWIRKDFLVPGNAVGTGGQPAVVRATGEADPAAVARVNADPSAAPQTDRQAPVVSGPSADSIDRPAAMAPAVVSPLAAAAEAARSASAASRSGAAAKGGSSAAAPPPPVGSTPDRGSSLGAWIQPRALRGSVGFGYQSANVRQASGSLDDRRAGGLASIAASFAVLDPQILNVDFSGEFQLGRSTNTSSTSAFRDKTGLNSYRLEVGVLTGRSAPLHVYSDRASATSDLQSTGDSLDPLRHTRGVRSATGFTWDVTAPHLPRIQLSASTGQQVDERDYLFGYSSTNRERRAELRISGERPKARFDFNLTHGDFLYQVADADMSSRTGSDLLLASGRLSPSARLTLDVHARASRFKLGNGFAASSVTGVGGDAAARYRFTTNVSAIGRYSRSTNTFEAMLSGQVDPRQAAAASIPSTALTSPSVFSDGEVRVERATRQLTTAAIFKTVSFGVPSFLPPTMTALTTAGGLVSGERTVKGLTLRAGGDGSVGTAGSNQGLREPYREVGIQAGVASNVGRLIRFGLDGNVRRTSRLDFYPVNLESRFVTAHVETTRPGWAVVHASVTRFDTLRDIVYADNRDQHTGYTVGVGSRWYDATVDVGQSNTTPLFLSSTVLGSRPDVVLLLLSRPDLVRNLLISTDQSKAFSLQVRPLDGLTVQGRVRRLEQAYPGLLGFQIRGAQLWATYQLRDLQLEFGMESFDSVTSYGNVRDRRIYVKVRRDLLFMR